MNRILRPFQTTKKEIRRDTLTEHIQMHKIEENIVIVQDGQLVDANDLQLGAALFLYLAISSKFAHHGGAQESRYVNRGHRQNYQHYFTLRASLLQQRTKARFLGPLKECLPMQAARSKT